ncbi:hypothetical protein ACVWW9_000279 [Agrococcus sp. UYP33]
MAWSRSALVLAVLLSVLTGCTAPPPSPTPSDPPPTEAASANPLPSQDATPPVGPTPRVDPAPSASAGPSSWPTYVSTRYGFRIGHPPGWRLEPSQRAWTMEVDAADWDSVAHESFWSPHGDVRVSAWAVPFRGEASMLAVERWAQQLCHESGNSDCATIGQRAVRLCSERRACHPGLLVPFDTDVHAFFVGGPHADRMTVVAVWRPADWSSDRNGSARDLLAAFLSTMDVRPLT